MLGDIRALSRTSLLAVRSTNARRMIVIIYFVTSNFWLPVVHLLYNSRSWSGLLELRWNDLDLQANLHEDFEALPLVRFLKGDFIDGYAGMSNRARDVGGQERAQRLH